MQSNQPLERRGISLLAISHAFTDINQGAIPALIPFLISQRGYSYTTAAGVLLAGTVVSSILQPLLGNYSDKHPLPWLIPAGLAVAGIGMALCGIAPTYQILMISVLVSGIGVAAFHPEAYRFVNYVSGEEKAQGTSYFSVGGTLGFALGPVVITGLLLKFGFPGTLILIVPTILIAVLILFEMPRLEKFRPQLISESYNLNGGQTNWNAVIRVTGVLLLRVALSYGLSAFTPQYLIQYRSLPIPIANGVLSILSLAGIAGTLSSAFLASHLGFKRALIIFFLPVAPLIVGFILAPFPIEVICIALIGFSLSVTFTIAVVMGQAYAPGNIGAASGLTTGLAIGLGSLTTPILGKIGDQNGLAPVFMILMIPPVLATFLAGTLPALAVLRPFEKKSIEVDRSVENLS